MNKILRILHKYFKKIWSFSNIGMEHTFNFTLIKNTVTLELVNFYGEKSAFHSLCKVVYVFLIYCFKYLKVFFFS